MGTSIGAAVRTVRTQMELTQDELAAKAGLSRSYISRLEHGDIKSPSADFLFRIARAVGVHPDVFFDAAGYREFRVDEATRRRNAVQWIADETITWKADELLFWARMMIHLRDSTQAWQMTENDGRA